ncbi:hypothetical protein CG723_08300 [Streptomyces sp. CB01635]|nr:hypothetical protein CG723_08300 [Streptomyces sp. CB01635]
MAAVYAPVMLGGTLPIPLYALRAPQMGFGPFTTTMVSPTSLAGLALGRHAEPAHPTPMEENRD